MAESKDQALEEARNLPIPPPAPPPTLPPSSHLSSHATNRRSFGLTLPTAPQIRPLVLHRQDRRRRNAQIRRERNPAIHRGPDGTGVGADRYLQTPSHRSPTYFARLPTFPPRLPFNSSIPAFAVASKMRKINALTYMLRWLENVSQDLESFAK